jgi:hypothetical protein
MTLVRTAETAVIAVVLGVSGCSTPGALPHTGRPGGVPIPALAQTDYPTTKLGTGRFTIGSSGCFLTSLTMASCQLHGTKKLNPLIANELVKKNNGFSGSALELDRALPALGLKKLLRREMTSGNRANLIRRLDNALAAKRPVIMGVDFQKGSSSGESGADHFIIVFGTRGSYYRAIDPLGGRLVELEKTSAGLTYAGVSGHKISEMLFVDKAPFVRPFDS